MNIAELKKKRKITISEFIEYAANNSPSLDPKGQLSQGDLIVSPDVFVKDCVCLDVVVGINRPEEGDFVSRRNITGPIRGNIFIQTTTGRLLIGDQSYDNGSVLKNVEWHYHTIQERIIRAFGEPIAREIMPSLYYDNRAFY